MKFGRGPDLTLKKFKKLYQWSVLDEVPGGLGKMAGFVMKDMVNIRGTGQNAADQTFLITKFKLK